MRNNLKVAHLAAPRHPLRALEDQIDGAIADNASVTLAMLDARKRAGLAAAQGHILLKRNLDLGVQLGQLRGDTVSLHADCLTFLQANADAEEMYGDQWDCPKTVTGA